MLNFIAGGILGLIVGGVGVYFLMLTTKGKPTETVSDNPLIEAKKTNCSKLENFIAQKQTDDKITNNEVEKLLDVSDATAERYLDEFEKEGKLKQIGKTGVSTYYQKED